MGVKMPVPTPELLAMAERAAKAEGVPPELVKAVVEAESGWNPRAYRWEQHLGEASYGLMQTLESTARSVGFSGDANLLLDPAVSLMYGSRFLAQLLRANGGKWTAAIPAYNAGQGGVNRAIAKAGNDDLAAFDKYLPKITRDYWRKVFIWAEHYAGRTNRAIAIAKIKAGEVTSELLAWAGSPDGSTVAVILGGLLLLWVVSK